MSEFEFVLVSFAIVIGFGISEILDGWGGQIRARRRVRPYPLQIASSAYILWFCLQYLWILWVGRDAEWTFFLYITMAIPALAIALAAHIIKIDTSIDAEPARDQYFYNSGPAYAVLVLFPAIALLMSFTTDLRSSIPNPPSLLVASIARSAVVGLLASMAWSRSEQFHWIALFLVWLIALGFVLRVAFRLS